MVGGVVVVGDDKALAEQMGFLQNSVAPWPDPLIRFLPCVD